MFVTESLSPLPRELVVNESASVAAKGHGLVLKVTLPTLVADGAVEGMVHEKKLHHPFSVMETYTHVHVYVTT